MSLNPLAIGVGIQHVSPLRISKWYCLNPLAIGVGIQLVRGLIRSSLMYGLNPLAVRASIQLGYAKPTAGQAKRSQSPRARGIAQAVLH